MKLPHETMTLVDSALYLEAENSFSGQPLNAATLEQRFFAVSPLIQHPEVSQTRIWPFQPPVPPFNSLDLQCLEYNVKPCPLTQESYTLLDFNGYEKCLNGVVLDFDIARLYSKKLRSYIYIYTRLDSHCVNRQVIISTDYILAPHNILLDRTAERIFCGVYNCKTYPSTFSICGAGKVQICLQPARSLRHLDIALMLIHRLTAEASHGKPLKCCKEVLARK